MVGVVGPPFCIDRQCPMVRLVHFLLHFCCRRAANPPAFFIPKSDVRSRYSELNLEFGILNIEYLNWSVPLSRSVDDMLGLFRYHLPS